VPEDSEFQYENGFDVEFTSCFVPRDSKQEFVVKESVQLLAKGESFIIEAGTGFGKTYMAMDIIAQVGKKTLVVVTKEDIRDQWVAAAKAVLGLNDSEIGFIQGDVCGVAGKKLVISLIQSLYKEGRYSPNVFKEFGLVIFDEVHRCSADKFSQSCYRVPAKLRLGLSATPLRKDGREEVIFSHIGKVKVKVTGTPLTPKVIVRRSPWKIPMTRIRKEGGYYIGPVPHSAGKCGHIINMLVKHEGRNLLIVRFVEAAYKKGRTIIVQSDRKEHLENLMLLCQSCGIHQSMMSMYIGGMTSLQREVAKKAKIIFATYGMTAEATDIPWLDTLVMATPKSDVKQIVGRILRLHEGKQQPIVFDMVDDSSAVFAGYWNRRREFYDGIKAEVVTPK
jgi:superfamily II DNA or RNA helicase